MANLVKKAAPILIETGKVIAKNTADVIANPRPGETVKDKVVRVAKQTSIDLMVNGIPKNAQQLPSSSPEN